MSLGKEANGEISPALADNARGRLGLMLPPVHLTQRVFLQPHWALGRSLNSSSKWGFYDVGKSSQFLKHLKIQILNNGSG